MFLALYNDHDEESNYPPFTKEKQQQEDLLFAIYNKMMMTKQTKGGRSEWVENVARTQ